MFVIFGASGDLTQRKLFPALYELASRQMLPERFAVVGTARSPMTSDESFATAMEEAVREHARVEFKPESLGRVRRGSMYYVPMEFADERGRGACRRAARGGRPASAAPTATASTTSPCRRARSRRSCGEIGERAPGRGLGAR